MYAEPHLWVSEESREQRAQGEDFSFFLFFFLHNESRDERCQSFDRSGERFSHV